MNNKLFFKQLVILFFVFDVLRKILIEQGWFHQFEEIWNLLGDYTILQDIGHVKVEDLFHIADCYINWTEVIDQFFAIVRNVFNRLDDLIICLR